MTALAPLMRRRSGAWIGWPGSPPRRSVEPVDSRRHRLVPVPLTRPRSRGLLRGLLERHAVAALPRRRRAAGVPPALVRRLRAVNQRFADAAARTPPTVRPSGCTTTSCSSSRRMLRELRPDLRIGFFLHIPFPPTELFTRLPRRKELLDGLLGADLVGFQRPGAAQLRPAPRDRLGLAPAATSPPADRRREPRTTRSASTSGSSTAWPASPRRCAGRSSSGGPRQPEARDARRRPARLHQGHRPAPQRLRRAAGRGQDQRRRRQLRPGRHARAASGSSSTGSCATRSSCRSAGSTASTAGSASTGDPLPALLVRP